MGKLFTNSYVRPVYYAMGEINGQKQYRRAPFDVVVIDGKPNIQPRAIGGSDAALGVLGYASAEDQVNWRDHDMGGYETLQPIVIDECQMGDGTDTWMGLNAISNF